MEALSQFESREAQTLMTEALEAMDTMNNAIILQNEVQSHVLCLLILSNLSVMHACDLHVCLLIALSH